MNLKVPNHLHIHRWAYVTYQFKGYGLSPCNRIGCTREMGFKSDCVNCLNMVYPSFTKFWLIRLKEMIDEP